MTPSDEAASFLSTPLEFSDKCAKIEMQATTFLRECEI